VINGAGLIGKVEDATGSSSIVTLITDQSFATGVYVGTGRAPGTISPSVGAPGDLLVEPVKPDAAIHPNDTVFTMGTVGDGRLKSRYPPAIPIGTFSRVDLGNGDLNRRIHVRPVADMLALDMVQVLTKPYADLGQ